MQEVMSQLPASVVPCSEVPPAYFTQCHASVVPPAYLMQ